MLCNQSASVQAVCDDKCFGLTFHTEEPGDGNEQEADDAPNPEEIATDVVQANGSDHDDDELLIISKWNAGGMCRLLTFESQ